jgi:GWxTD domain-containing protein
VPASAPAAALTVGPLKWLMLPDEARQVRRLDTSRESVEFLERFWRRRNPDPANGPNDCARVFHERVADADHLYPEGMTRGSLTDRGRALVLLGPPPVLRYGRRRIPSREPGRTTSKPILGTREATVETWVYPRTDLTPELAALVASETPDAIEVTIEFVEETPRHSRLLDGEHLLDLAAQSLIRR